MTDGFGTITWWGFSPCLDLQHVEKESDITNNLSKLNVADQAEDRELNILLVGAGDCRHVLKTCAHMYRHTAVRINFYVLENNLELYARFMLLMTIALESPDRMGLQEKTELFLELYGNIQVRAQSLEYVEKMSTEFIRMVTDFDYLEQKLPTLDLSNLKFKERDMLEAIFKFWRNTDRSLIDMPKYLDLRLRQYLGARYDAIPNVFDWDYNMKLVEKGASIIFNKHYTRWRHKGNAFEIRDGTYDASNKTLVSGMIFKHEGERTARRGYWGDIVVSPFISFGIECEDKSFFKLANKLHTHTAEDVSEFNVLSMLYEITNKEKYVKPAPPPAEDGDKKQQTATLTEITEEEEEEEDGKSANPEEAENKDAENAKQDEQYESMRLEGVKVYFLPLNSAHDLCKKSKYQKKFDVVYLSNSMVHLLNGDLAATFAERASVILETAKFMLELKKEQCVEFGKKITQIAQSVGCKAVGDFDGEKDCFAYFQFTRNETLT